MALSIFDLLVFFLSCGLLHGIKYRLTQQSIRVLLGLMLGLGYGLLLQMAPPGNMQDSIKSLLSLIGNGYLILLKMLVVPLILTSIMHAILNLGAKNEQILKKMSFMTCGMLLGMTALSSLIALCVGHLFGVGQGLSIPLFNVTPKHAPTNLTDTLLGMLPANPVTAMAEGNTVAIILFTVLFAMSARLLDAHDHAKLHFFKELIATLFAIVKKLAGLVLRLTPYGVLSLMALLLIDQGTALLGGMLNFIAAMYVAM